MFILFFSSVLLTVGTTLNRPTLTVLDSCFEPQTLETPSQGARAHPALPSLFQLLPSAWYFLLLPLPDPNTVDPVISAALVEDQTSAFTVTINATLSDSDSDDTILDPRDITSWLPSLLDVGLQLQPGSLAVGEWLAALNVMVPLSRDYGAWSKVG